MDLSSFSDEVAASIVYGISDALSLALSGNECLLALCTATFVLVFLPARTFHMHSNIYFNDLFI